MKAFYYRHQFDGIHAVKYVLAFLLGYAVMQILPAGRSQWMMITIAVVMGSQAVIGLQVNKAILRILGTLVGAGLGLLALSLPHNHYVVVATLVVAALFFVTLSIKENDMSYVGTLGMTTFVMVALLVPASYELALLRVVDILIGVVISLTVSRFIFPLNSRRAFALTAKKNFDQLGRLIAMMFIEQRERRNDPDVLELDAKIGGGIAKLRLIIKALRYESVWKNRRKEELLQVLRYFRALYRYHLFLDSVLTESRQESPDTAKQWIPIVADFSHSVIKLLKSFEMDKSFSEKEAVVVELQRSADEFHRYFNDSQLDSRSTMRAQAIIFTVNHIVRCGKRLTLAWNQLTNVT